MIKDINFKEENIHKVTKMLKYIDDNDLASTGGDCHMNLFIHKNKEIFGKELNDKMKIIQTEICFRSYCDYWKCIKSRRLEERYSEILSSHFVGKNNYLKEDFLKDIIKSSFAKKKILFIILDFIDYGLDDDIKDKNVYVPHVCLLLLIPNGESYEAFYINSHGKDMLIYNTFEFKISSKKKRTIQYDHPVDLMFVKTFVDFMNQQVQIKYDFTEKHNYFGADYQSGDKYGICFIFPYIIWYYFGKYYNNSRTIVSKGKEYTIQPNKEMLLNGDLTECIESYLIDLNKNYKEMYVKMLESKNYNRIYYVRKLDKVLEKSKDYFVKKLLNVFMPFFSQGLVLTN